MATETTLIFTKLHGCGKVKYNGNTVQFGVATTVANGGQLVLKNKKKGKKFSVTVVGQDDGFTVTLTGKSILVLTAGSQTGTLETCKECAKWSIAVVAVV